MYREADVIPPTEKTAPAKKSKAGPKIIKKAGPHMRIKLNLNAPDNVAIPIEYNYNVYQNIRKNLFEYLGIQKPKLYTKYKKNFPTFTFSQLMIPERTIEPGFIHVKGNYFSLFLASADETFMEYLVKSIALQGRFQIFTHTFTLKKLEILTDPEFTHEMRFKMLSSLLLIQMEDQKMRFVRPEDTDMQEIFANHLLERFHERQPGKFSSNDIKIILDQDYMQRKAVLTKAIMVRNMNYKTIFCPFSLHGEPELIQFAYHNGIGDNTHYGFGMIETVE